MKNKKGFSLIEILVVATIIGLLAAGAAVSYSQFAKQSRDARRKADLEQIRAALEMYRSNSTTSIYPDITIDCSSTGGITDDSIPATYLSKIPRDPKCPTTSYFYSQTGSNYTIGAYLESTGDSSCQAGCGDYCNYCLDAYGQTN